MLRSAIWTPSAGCRQGDSSDTPAIDRALPETLTRSVFAAAVVAVSLFIHLGLLGVIVMAERRGLPRSQTETIEVELLKPEPPEEPVKEPPPPPEKIVPKQKQALQQLQQPPQQQQPRQQQQEPAKNAKPSSDLSMTEPQAAESAPPPAEEKPNVPSGGAPSETKAKLTAEEIAAFRAEIQKCWELPVGMPNAMKLEVVLRVGLSRKGTVTNGPELLKAPASTSGPRLVGIAMKAMQQCQPYRSLPASKYNEWKVLDLRFLATGMAGLDTTKVDVSKLKRQ